MNRTLALLSLALGIGIAVGALVVAQTGVARPGLVGAASQVLLQPVLGVGRDPGAGPFAVLVPPPRNSESRAQSGDDRND